MYHCHVHFHLVGIRQDVFAVIEAMSPLSCFTHEFTKSEAAGGPDMDAADVILADLRDMNVEEAVRTLTVNRGGRYRAHPACGRRTDSAFDRGAGKGYGSVDAADDRGGDPVSVPEVAADLQDE